MGAIHSIKIQTGPTGKSGPPQKVDQFFPLDRTDPLSFEPKFPEILVEWIAPNVSLSSLLFQLFIPFFPLFIFILLILFECFCNTVNRGSPA